MIIITRHFCGSAANINTATDCLEMRLSCICKTHVGSHVQRQRIVLVVLGL